MMLEEPAAKMKRDLLLHELVDYNMLHHGEESMYTFHDDITGSNVSVSFLEFGRACHRLAHFIRPNHIGKDGEVVAIVAHLDNIFYHAITLGIMLAGWIPFPMSPRNSAPAVASMIQKTYCSRMLVSSSTLPDTLPSGVQKELPEGFMLNIVEIPSFASIYPLLGKEKETDQFEAFYVFSQHRSPDDIALYLHSSGSTGFPKPIPETFKCIKTFTEMEFMTARSTMQPRVKVGLLGMPPFHILAFLFETASSLVNSFGTCSFPPMAIYGKPPLAPTSDTVIEHARKTNTQAIMIVSSFINAWATENIKETIDFLKTMKFITYGGSPLPFEKGQYLIDQGIKLRAVYGATELGLITLLEGAPDDPHWFSRDWNYFQFSDRVKVRMIPQGDGETYEGQFLTCNTHQMSVENLPDVKGYASRDLFRRHPTRPNLWTVVGRLDDVIVLATGEKTVASPMEDKIGASQLVDSAVMFGRGRNQVGILIEPRIFPKDKKVFIDSIWPVIKAANVLTPTFGRVFKNMVLLTRPEKRLRRTEKGSVMKKASIAQFEQEIQALYDSLENHSIEFDSPKEWTSDGLQAWILKQVSQLTSKSGKTIDPGTNLFEQGFDSLSATFLRNQIVSALGSRKDQADNILSKVPYNLVFSRPTISELVQFMLGLTASQTIVSPSPSTHRVTAIQDCIAKFSADFTGERRDGSLILPAVVLVTGTTGSLGSFLLDSLLRDSRVSKVYAYNRPGKQSSKERQASAFTDRGLDAALLDSPKLVFVEGVLHKENLGVSVGLCNELLSSVTTIIHNAWQLDFNLSLISFETQIASTRQLIDLALTSPLADSIRFMYMSSISSAQSWRKDMGPYPEEIQMDPLYAVGGGYGESKYVCEHILANSGLQATSFRIGQISGPVSSGSWATTDWVPIFVKSSLVLGALPNSAGRISWLPATAVNDCVMDVLFAQERPPLVLNVVHPKPVGWTTVMSSIRDALMNTECTKNQANLDIVPFSEWFGKLEVSAEQANSDTLRDIPAIKIINFFRSFVEHEQDTDAESSGVSFSTTKMHKISQSFNQLSQLGQDDGLAWVNYWKSKGLFA